MRAEVGLSVRVCDVMKIYTTKDTDNTDAIILTFSNKSDCMLNNLQLDHLKEWLNNNWDNSSLRGDATEQGGEQR